MSAGFNSHPQRGDPEQNIATAKLQAIVQHRATPTTKGIGQGSYPIGQDIYEVARVEEGDPLYRYYVHPTSTMDGDPSVCFRHLNGLAAGILVIFAGFSKTDFLPEKTTSNGENPTSLLSVQVAGYVRGTYVGSQAANKYSPIFVHQPSTNTPPFVIARADTTKRNLPVHACRFYAADQVRGSQSVSERASDFVYEVINGMTQPTDGASSTQALVDGVEEELLDNDSPVRIHLMNAGYTTMKAASGGLAYRGANGGNVAIPLGLEFITEYDNIMSSLYEAGRATQDAVNSLTEMIKLRSYMTYILTENKLPVADELQQQYWILEAQLEAVFLRYYGAIIVDGVFAREYQYIGRVMKDVRPNELNAPFSLAT